MASLKITVWGKAVLSSLILMAIFATGSYALWVSATVLRTADMREQKREPLQVDGKVMELRLVKRVDPVYPELAIRGRMEGVVQLSVLVSESGEVASARIIGGGYPPLQPAALEAVKQWRYAPYLDSDGRAVPVITTASVAFRLSKDVPVQEKNTAFSGLQAEPLKTGGGPQNKARARDLGIPFEGTPGQWNAITDVKGIEVGHETLIEGEGKLVSGKGPVRTGVTAIFPQGRSFRERVFGAWFTLNGNGEMTGTTWLKESGCLGTPILITNTHSVGVVRDAVIEWNARRGLTGDYSGDFSLPVVAETWDGFLNDIDGFHVKKEHVFKVLDSARSGPVAEGNVGGGTGMVCHQFKGGIGTSSRVLAERDGGYVIGVLVQANYGSRDLLTIAGVPVGKEIPDLLPRSGKANEDQGSIIVVVGTDAPLLPHQLDRLVRRVPLGIGIVGGRGGNSSGDIFIAFSTANPEAGKTSGTAGLTMLPNERMNPLFNATAQAVEEAIVNALVAAETMTGINGNTVYALPHDRLREVLGKYNRLVK